MCEATVYLKEENGQKKLMDNVAVIKPEADNMILVGLFGERLEVKAKISEIKLVEHEVILEKR